MLNLHEPDGTRRIREGRDLLWVTALMLFGKHCPNQIASCEH